MDDHDNWTPVTGEELQGFLVQIDPIDGKYEVSADTTQVARRHLSFYDQVILNRITNSGWTPPDLKIFYLADQENLYRLNGTAPPIHEVNAQAPVKITDDSVLEYLRFFCFFVRAEEGPNLIVESLDHPDMPKDMDDKTRAIVEGALRPAVYEGTNEQGKFLCKAVVYYSNALFLANFAIQPSGMIEMLDDQAMVADLPVRVDAPIA